MEKPDFQALSAELPDCPIGEIEMHLDEMLENFKQGEPNAAKWYVFVDKVKRNCLKLSLCEERQAVIVEWAKYARFDLNKQISGTLKGTITEDGSLVLEEPPRVVSETWKRISARAAAPFPSLEALNNESTPTTSSVPTSKNVVARAEAAMPPAETIPTVGAAEVKPKATLPAAIPVDFSLYIKEEYREKLLPFLKQHYTDSKPGPLTCMLFALYDLGALTIAPIQANQTALHKALAAYFGDIGKLQSLNISFTKHNSASSAQQLSIETRRKIIKERLAES